MATSQRSAGQFDMVGRGAVESPILESILRPHLVLPTYANSTNTHSTATHLTKLMTLGGQLQSPSLSAQAV